MAGLSGPAVLRVWEVGAGQRRPERALALLAAGSPGLAPERLAGLSLGQRNGHLLRLREETFGPDLAAYAECPRCRERLELGLAAAAMRAGEAFPADDGAARAVEVGEFRLSFRLPTGDDLAAVAAAPDRAAGRTRLLERCLLAAERGGRPMAAAELPEAVVAALGERMAEADPQAELLLDLTCPACGQAWQAPLDIADFLWAEVADEARRLLREVHLLARAYGWREADILAMSAHRRQGYLAMLEE